MHSNGICNGSHATKRINQLVRTEFARDRIHTYYVWHEFLPSILFMVIAYARPRISSTRYANCFGKWKQRVLSTPPHEFSEPSRDWKALPSPRKVNVLFRITRRYTRRETRRISGKLTQSWAKSSALCFVHFILCISITEFRYENVWISFISCEGNFGVASMFAMTKKIFVFTC